MKYERLAIVVFVLLDLAENYDVIAAVILLDLAANEIRNGPADNRNSSLAMGEVYAREFVG